MLSKTMLIGNVGADPESRNMPNGSPVVNFSLATSERWKDKDGGKQEKTSWHRLVCFGKLAEIIQQHVKKGDRLYVEGRLDYQEYEKDGVKKYSTQIVVNSMQMLGSKDGTAPKQSAPQQAAQPAQAAQAQTGGEFDDDIPFSAVHSYP